MAKMTSIIRYKYKADREFESVQFEGMSCSLGELKRLIVEKSSKSGTHHTRDDYDLIISNSTTHQEYKNSSEMIPRNTSVVVARRIRGTFKSLTPLSNQLPLVSSDDIVNEFLRPAIKQSTKNMATVINNQLHSSTVVEGKSASSDTSIQSSNNVLMNEKSEDELIKEVVKTSQAQYMTAHRSKTLYTCHNCKQAGHLRHQCPLLLSASSVVSKSATNSSTVASTTINESSSKTDQIQTSGPDKQTVSNTSRIVTNQPPYQMAQHHNPYHNNRPYTRGSGHPRPDPLPKKTTGIPRDGLIPISRYIRGAMRDQTGAHVMSRQMAELIIEQREKRVDTLTQRGRQLQDKNSPSATSISSTLTSKSAEDEAPTDLLCPICKKVYTDAVITPCCLNNFCDECIRSALIESEHHQCPQCQRQYVAIDQINPNLFLRKHINRWHEERQNKSSYSYINAPNSLSSNFPISSPSLPIFDQDTSVGSAKKPEESSQSPILDDADECNVSPLSTTEQQSQQISTVWVKAAPIVIRMQPIVRTPSPQPTVVLKIDDDYFEDEKAPNTDQTTSSEKTQNSNPSVANNKLTQERSLIIDDLLPPLNATEDEKHIRQTPPSQVAPTNATISSPSTIDTTITSTSSIVPYYYPNIERITPHVHHEMMYSQQLPSTASSGIYSMQSNFYQPPLHVPLSGTPYSLGTPILPVAMPPGPAGLLQPFARHPLYPHPSMSLPPIQQNPITQFNLGPYEVASSIHLHHPTAAFSVTPTSTLISHRQSAAQTLPASMGVPMSKDEFYRKQRNLQHTQRSSSNHNSRSRSTSFSSYTSSDSRSTSSHSRRNNQYRRRQHHRSSHSRSVQRTSAHRRTKSPVRDHNRKRRRSPDEHHQSSSDRNRSRISSNHDHHLLKPRRNSPQSYRPTEVRKRRRSPRPPPTIQQSVQRTIVYARDSSSSTSTRQALKQNDDHHKNRTHSRHLSKTNDDCTTPSSQKEQESSSEPRMRSSSSIVPSEQQYSVLASKIEPVHHENLSASSSMHSSKRHRTSRSSSTNRSYNTKIENKTNHPKTHRDRSKNSNFKHKKYRHDEENRGVHSTIIENSSHSSRTQ